MSLLVLKPQLKQENDKMWQELKNEHPVIKVYDGVYLESTYISFNDGENILNILHLITIMKWDV